VADEHFGQDDAEQDDCGYGMNQAQIAKIGLCPWVQSCIQQEQVQVVPAQSLPQNGDALNMLEVSIRLHQARVGITMTARYAPYTPRDWRHCSRQAEDKRYRH
jgi:hypothetical protein